MLVYEGVGDITVWYIRIDDPTVLRWFVFGVSIGVLEALTILCEIASVVLRI